MALSAETLYPLTATTVTFTYCYDRPLQDIATRYIPVSRAKHDTAKKPFQCSLVLAGGISLNQETWLPFIKELYRLSSDSLVYIRSIWTVERPNHGEAALLNAQELNESYYTDYFPQGQYGMALEAFLYGEILASEEKQNLIGIGHSGGGCALIRPFSPPNEFQEIPFRALIIIESPLVDSSAASLIDMLCMRVKNSNLRRPSSWENREGAIRWYKTHFPSMKFHSHVLQIIEETYFYSDASGTERIFPKTKPAQETNAFLDADRRDLAAWPYLRSIAHKLPTHVINGEKRDLWLKGIHDLNEKHLREDRHLIGSVHFINGVGHYIPVERPQELAEVVLRILAMCSIRAARL